MNEEKECSETSEQLAKRIGKFSNWFFLYLQDPDHKGNIFIHLMKKQAKWIGKKTLWIFYTEMIILLVLLALEKEVRDLKLDLRMEKREVEKKTNLGRTSNKDSISIIYKYINILYFSLQLSIHLQFKTSFNFLSISYFYCYLYIFVYLKLEKFTQRNKVFSK